MILRGPKFEVTPLVLTPKMRPLALRPGMSPCPLTMPLIGNTVQVSNEDTGQNT